MTLTEAAKILEVELPEGMEQYEGAENLCTEELIDSLEKKYALLGKYQEAVKNGVREISKDEAMSTWLASAAAYYQDAEHDQARDLPTPLQDGSIARDFLPLAVLLPTVNTTFENYLKRGFSKEEAIDFLKCIRLNLQIVEERNLGRPALTSTYFRWLAHYMKCTIFDHGGLNFEMKKSPSTLYFLKKKYTDEYALLAVRESVHRDGMPLGSAGYEEEEGSFKASFEETDEAYIGYPVENFLIQNSATQFSKREWELVCKPEDDVINVHIPRKTDLSPDKIHLAYKDALKLVKERYPDYNPKVFLCSSWLMDPTLQEILGEDSRISQFQKPYIRCPNKSAGKEIFSFVFKPHEAKDLSALPENTRLERNLKEMYLNGKYIYAYAGMMPFEKV